MSARSQLSTLRSGFSALSERAAFLVAAVGETRLTKRPAPNKWSVADCLVHLTLSTNAFLPLWSQALAKARTEARPSGKDYKMDFWGCLLKWSLEPPPRFRFPAPPSFQPPSTVPADQVLPQFLASQEELLTTLASSDGLAIDRYKIVSPFSSPVKYSVWSSFCICAAHERRHLWQAERVIEALHSRT
jgi:hypothetical protein